MEFEKAENRRAIKKHSIQLIGLIHGCWICSPIPYRLYLFSTVSIILVCDYHSSLFPPSVSVIHFSNSPYSSVYNCSYPRTLKVTHTTGKVLNQDNLFKKRSNLLSWIRLLLRPWHCSILLSLTMQSFFALRSNGTKKDLCAIKNVRRTVRIKC